MNSKPSSPPLPLKRPVIAFAVAALAVGAYWWPSSYGEIQVIPSWWVFALISVVVASVFASRNLSQSMLTGAAVAGGAVAAILIRIIFDVTADPTNHNLWPLELALAGIFTFPSALLGAAVGMVARRLFTRG